MTTKAKPVRYRMEGRFVGGCRWESRQTFATAEAARRWYARQTFVTPSRNVRAVPVKPKGGQ